MKNSSYKDLTEKILEKTSLNNCVYVLIGGCSRSGKSTLAEKISKSLNEKGINGIHIPLDYWIAPVENRKKNSTVKERYNYGKIVSDILRLKSGFPINLESFYDSKTRSLEKRKKTVEFSEGVCVIEGVVALDIKELINLAEIRVFVDISDSIRKNRLVDYYLNYKKLDLETTNNLINDRELEEVKTIKETRRNSNFLYKSQD